MRLGSRAVVSGTFRINLHRGPVPTSAPRQSGASDQRGGSDDQHQELKKRRRPRTKPGRPRRLRKPRTSGAAGPFKSFEKRPLLMILFATSRSGGPERRPERPLFLNELYRAGFATRLAFRSCPRPSRKCPRPSAFLQFPSFRRCDLPPFRHSAPLIPSRPRLVTVHRALV